MDASAVLTAVLPACERRGRAVGVVFVPADPAENAFAPVAGVLALTVGRATVAYRVEEHPADGGRGFHLAKLSAGTDPEAGSYSVFCSPWREASCECRGFLRWGHCKHSAAIDLCVAREWL